MNEEYIAILAQVGISEAIIENSFSQATLDRGIEYFESDRVEITSVESLTGQDIAIHADVFGSMDFAYHIVVTLKIGQNHTSVIGECDCPVGFRCKHAVATVFKFAQSNAESINERGELEGMDSYQAEQQVEQWLTSLTQKQDASHVIESAPDANPGYNNVLLYLLNPSEDGKDMEIITIVARRLKKGGYGKSRPQSLEDMVDGYSLHINFEHNELDVEIAGLLYSMTGRGLFYRQNVYAIKGDIGELTLEKLLSTQRCFWKTQELNQPLQFGAVRDFKLSWQETQMLEQQQYQISAEVTPKAVELFHLKHFFYLDSEHNQIGQAQHSELSDQQIEQILNAPPVPEEMAKKVSEQLLQAWPEYDVPMPVSLSDETIFIDSKPIADVIMHSIELEGRRVHLLNLRFNYDGHVIQPEKTSSSYRFLKEGQQYQINRDAAFELQCLTQLQQSHFVSAASLGLTQFNQLQQTIMADSATASLWHWHDFQYDVVPELQAQGWQFHFDESFNMQIEEADEWYGELEEQDNQEWFEISLGIELNGQTINLLPSLVELLSLESDPAQMRERILLREFIILPVTENAADEHNPRWVKLPSARIMGIFDTLVELYDTHALNDSGNLLFSKHQGLQLRALLNDPALKWKGAEQLQALSKKIQNFKGIEHVEPPEGLQTELRDYQQQGLNWLQFMREYQFNGILADDMGLGKTVQALVHLLHEKQREGNDKAELPSLVIAPTSLMGNWKREAKRFTPELNVLLLHGPSRKALFSEIENCDVILTTYALMLRDKEFHSEQKYNFVILDESQNIKNARSKTSQVIFKLKAKHRLCMTGTPMENHLGELWSLFHFLMPGFLGTQERFNRLFRSPIEKQGDADRQQQLHQRIKPFMLRRTKEMVATELPEKTEMIRTIPLTGKQRDLYETVRLAMDEKVREEISKKGLARSQIMILDALLKLRQTCCDPRLLSLSSAKDVQQSAKLDMLMEMVPEMVEEGRKIIIFSQFVKMLGFIEEELKKHDISYSLLTGQTRNRDDVIMDFQEGDAEVFLISLKAGGVGLNLTAADTVIHYDPWWNPAVERQATDRAYRIGQDKPVFVYKLLTEETVEEKILAMQNAKQKLADGLYQDEKAQGKKPGDKGTIVKNIAKKGPQFSQQELMDLLNPLNS
ncbi:DEAD/DEAH box helicase [sulfur-oxidizing endosymbiont of Gigantopelta aegis]|uniref:DEAD/DEAH box helicase n=1 Tax=sulfur-oxidizing endosymbiont of Gigantopelta aegis TaxID=2794934 RepID=UPI0018DE7178|nr:DEAD/DEAH box helicase [sulfur-oxidizing endosymbiont of Gigantopelta aegis]